MKIGILSDTHLSIREEPFKHLVEKNFIKAINILSDCDIIIHAGDIFDKRTPSTESVLFLIKYLKGKKIFYINGNHDNSRIYEETMMDKLRMDGFIEFVGKDISNHARILELSEYNIIGIDNLQRDKFNSHYKKVLDFIDKKKRNILIVHQDYDPIFVKEAISNGFDMIIYGHTHIPKDEDRAIIVGSTSPTMFNIEEIRAKNRVLKLDKKIEEYVIDKPKILYEDLDLRGKSDLEINNILSTYKNYDGIGILNIKINKPIDLSKYKNKNIKMNVEYIYDNNQTIEKPKSIKYSEKISENELFDILTNSDKDQIIENLLKYF